MQDKLYLQRSQHNAEFPMAHKMLGLFQKAQSPMTGLKEEAESKLGGRRGLRTEETQDKPFLARRHRCKKSPGQLNNNKQSNLKMGKGVRQTFLQRGHTNSQEAREKMLSITNS